METELTEAWLAERYGLPAVAEAGGVWLAVVPVRGGKCMGLGSSRANALLDLKLALTAPDLRVHEEGRASCPEQWELRRREWRNRGGY